MKTIRHFLNWSALFFALSCFFSFQLNAQSGIIPPANPLPQRTIAVDDLRSWLLNAPKENAGNAKSKIIVIDLPMPGGTSVTFRAVETQMMEKELSEAFPQIKTYRITSMLNPNIYGNLTVSPRGMDALISTPEDNVFIEPVSVGSDAHFVYYQKDGSTFVHPEQDMFFDNNVNNIENSGQGKNSTHQHGEGSEPHEHGENGLVKAFNGALNIGTDLRTYRVHITTKKEYSAQHDGGAVTLAAQLTNVTAVIMAQINASSLLYERDIAIRLTMVTPTIFLDDPEDNNGNPVALFTGDSLATEALEVYDQLDDDDPNIAWDGLLLADYDLGHVFGGTGGNGSAFIGVVCRNTFVNGVGPGKGGGGTQSSNATGSGWIELFSHEMGHQFSALHTFNSDTGNCALANGQHSTTSAVEPGSGVTIMSYRGICGADNIKEINSTTNASIGFFGINSIEVINDYVVNGQGANCRVDINNNNTIPIANADPCGTGTITIPQRTPFELTGSATDADGDALTYSWEQYDLGTAGIPSIGISENSGDGDPVGATENGAPIFRPRDPMTTPTRQFPVYEKILSGLSLIDPTAVDGEILPIIDRTMTFRMTVRDGNGGVSCVERQVMTSTNATAFEVVTPIAATTWNTGGNVTVTWNNGGFLGCTNVNILLSIDGGNTFPYTLAASQSYLANAWTGNLPSNIPNTTQARVRVECADNTCVKFFNISPGDFNIVSSCVAESSVFCTDEAVTLTQGDAGLNLSLSPRLGAITSKTISFTGQPTAPYTTTVSGNNTGCETTHFNQTINSPYITQNFYTIDAGNYNFSITPWSANGNFIVMNVYENSFDPANTCTNLVWSSGNNADSSGSPFVSSSMNASLNACTDYVLVAMLFQSNGNTAANHTITYPTTNTAYEFNTASVADYAYTYVAVNTANDQVTVVDAGADFTTLPGGTFQVYGVSYYSGAGPTPPMVDPTSWVGMTLAQIQAADCVVFSTNNKMLTINGNAVCVADAGDLTTTTTTSSFTICSGSDLLDDAMASAIFAADYTAADETDPGAGYDYAFILADASGNIIQTNTTGDFDFTTITTAGTYDIYGLSYDNANTPTSVTAYLAALSPMTIAQINSDDDDNGGTFCLDLENLNSGGTAVQVVVNTIPTYTVMGNDPTTCGGTDGSISISGLTASTMYSVSYTEDGTPIAAATFTSDVSGIVTISGLDAGAYTNIIVSLNGCEGVAMMATLVDPINFTDAGLMVSACNDQTTTTDPSDDTFTFTLNPTGTDAAGNPLSGMYTVSGDATGTGTYGAATTFDNSGAGFLITGGTLTITITDNVNGSCQIMNVMVVPSASCSGAVAGCSELFFSEYVEGSSNNKCLEIYNPTAAAIDLAAGNYVINRYSNGGTTPVSIPLTGTIAAGDVFVICNPNSAAALLAEADATSNNINFNGDDAIELVANGTTIDVIGQIGVDPGTEWTGACGGSTANNTLRRKSTIQTGDTDGSDAFDPCVEYDNFAIDDFTGIGAHASDCVMGCNLSSAGKTLETCNDNMTPTDPADDYITFSLNPVGSDLGANYTVTVDNGGMVTLADGNPASGVAYNTDTAFRLVDGSADGATTYTITVTDSDDATCTVTTTVMQSSCSNSVAPCSNLFISEYIEGASNDKCIEIYNPTGAAIDLAAGNYVINRYSNGGTTPAPIPLTGTIASGDVFVICNPNANATLLALADDTSGGLSFNGDDALELVANGTTIDVFGQIGVDPGAGWTGACGGTQNMTLRRMMSIQSGDGNGADTFDPCVEYNAFPDNDFTGFGGHISTCIPCNISITSATPTATSCDGTSDGMIVITATTDNGEIEYSIDNGITFQSSNTFTGLAANTYNIVVRVVGEPTCNDNTTATVAAGQAVMIGNTMITDETCAAANDGTITFNSSGPGTLEYSIDGGTTFGTNPAFTGLDAGTYNLVVQVQGTTACMDTDMVMIGAGMEVMIANVATTDESCAAEDDGTITITATGPGTLEYSIDNGVTFSTSNSFSGQTAATYAIIVQSQTNNACTASSTGTIDTDAEVMITDVMTTNETCPATDDGTITITATGAGILEYSIDNGATFQTSNIFTGQDAGTYNVVVRRVGTTNCTATTTTVVGSDSDVMITNVAVVDETCMAADDGSIIITATGNGTLEYSIDNGVTFQLSNTFTGQDAGTYNIVVQVQGSGVCNDTDVAMIGAGMEVMNTSNTVVDESCTAANDGSVTINATGPGTLEYSLDGSPFQTSNVFTGLDAGTFNLVIQTQGTTACQFMGTVTVGTSADVMITNVMTIPTSCDGATDGSIIITATGGGILEYSIDNGVSFQPSNTFNGLAPNTYNIVVQSAGTPVCMDTDMATIATGTAVDITSVMTTATSCDGATDGTITIAATGPTGATLEYSIDNGVTFSTMNVFNMQAASNYDIVVQVQGTTACNDTDIATVAVGTAVDITSIDTTPTSCDGATDGTITITATGPTGATLEYSIDNGATFSTMNVFNMQAAGNYDIVVQVQGTAACNDADVATIAVGTAVEITSVNTTPTSCDGEMDGTITINATGPGTLEYSIDGGTTFVTTNSFTGQPAATYDIVVQVQGTAACNDTDMATVAAGTAVNITSIDVVDETCAAANDGTFTVNATGPAGATLEYSMDNGVTFVTTNVFTAQDAGTFDVIVQVQGSAVCNDTLTTTIGTSTEVMITDVTTVDETCTGADDGSITITATGTGILEYSIGGAFQTSNTFTGLTPNTYTITVQSQTNNACTATTTATIGTAVDNTPPMAICQDITVDLDLNGEATILPADIDNGSNDNCGTIILTSVTPNTFTCLNVGPNTVTLVVTDGNSNTDNCTATVNVNASGACVPPMITNIGGPVGFDPCTCRGNGEFDEEVVVEAGTGQTWTIVSTDLINPATMMPYVAGTMLTETVIGAGVSTYSLVGIHLDGQGYTIIVDSPANPGAPLEMSNTCFYPDANLITDLSGDICVNTAPITLEGDGNGAAGTTAFTVNGVPTNIIDPAALGTGSFPVTFTFDAGEAGQFKITNGVVVGPPEGVNSLTEAEADPGCTETISTFINIVATPTTLGCNNNIQVSLDENCESLVTPDMLLEGDYLCFDNYEVTLAQGLNSNIPNPLTSANIGQNIIGTVTDLVSGNSCWTTITVEDKLAPVLDCQDVTIACTADANLVAAPVANDNCDPNPTVIMVDEVINTDNNCDPNPATGDAFTVTIVRTFIAVDNQGNTSATCQQVITVIRPDLIDIPDDLVWSCEQYAAYSYIIDSTRLMPSIAAQFGGAIQPFDNTGAWDLTNIALTDPRLTNNVPGTNMPTGSGVPSGIFLLANGNANPLGGALDAEYCKYAYSNADQILSTCDFAASIDSPVFKIVRTWTILDWCTGNVVTDPALFDANDDDNVQIIKVIDDTAPIVVGADVTISANIPAQHPQQCTGQGPIALGTATDNCTGAENIQGFVYADITLNSAVAQITSSGNGFGLLNPALPVGCYFVVWTAEDACGNVGQSTTYDLCIEDDIAPVAICDEITQVSLSSDGLAVVSAGTFDDGSYDNCCLDRLEVRRMTDNCGIVGNTTFDNDGDPNDANNDPDDGEFVTFCCEDINTTQMVALRVFDCSDNYNECMVQVLIEDKLAPTLVCPPNATLTCDEYADDLAAALLACEDATNEDACQSAELTAAGYGAATAFDNCEVTITPTVNVMIDQCGAGTVTRSFTSVDDSDNASNPCTQVITVTHVSDWVVEFPEDQDGFCDMTEPDFGEPEIFFETCELIATSFEDQFFDIVPDACFKIVRQWTVINWCVVGNEIDQEANAIELSEAELVSIIGSTNADLDGDGDRDDRTFRDSYRGVLPTSDNDSDIDNQDGFITYQQVIKVQDFDAPVIDMTFTVDDLCIIDGNDGTDADFSDCVFNGTLPTPTYEDCTLDVNGNLDNNGNTVENELTITATVFDANDNVVSNSVNIANLEIGTYTVRYVAVDRCGNTTATDYTFEINDCKLPTPYCKDGVVLELMHINDPNNTTFEPMVELWASDLDEGSFDNCPGGVQLSFSADVNDIGITYNCDNVGENLVQLWVTDAAGNQDFCETFVIIQANQNQCDDPDPLLAIGGNIATELNVDVADVEVNINGGTMNTMEMTDLEGNYNINVPAGGDYTIVPAKDLNPLNGVSTFDLVKISKHILNIELLDSPYKMIAADANKSETITTLDLVQIRKLILLIDDNFTNNTSWRFVDADFEFPNPTNPWATGFPEIININNLPADALSESFVAVKIGDVNGNASGNQLLGADDRSFDGTLELTTNDIAMKAGENYTVTFNAANFHNFGYQFTLDFDQDVLEVNDIENGLASAENFGMTLLNEGAITTSWNQASATRLAENEALFSITFTAKTDAQLSDVLQVNSRYTIAEAYAENGDLQDIQLTFNNSTIIASFELYQNMPNPFAETTKIGFSLPQAGNAVLTVHDASGRLLKTIDRDFAKGYNEVQISKDELSAKGVLYYQLETAGHTATKKMILN